MLKNLSKISVSASRGR